MEFKCITQNVLGISKLGKIEELCQNIIEKKFLFAMIQETWRFGKDEFNLHGCKFLHSGLDPPSPSTPIRRGRPGKEGVAIILSKQAIKAWDNANNFIYRHNARIISARLVFTPVNPNDKPIGIYIISAYAPSSQSSSISYLNELRICINKKDKDDILILGSDTNCSMGTKTSSNSITSNSVDSIGHFGLPAKNAAGIEFVSFLQSEDLVAMSTFFQKPAIKYQTWMHPRTKNFYQIDHIISNKESFNFFKDVSTTDHLVFSDHYPVLAKLRIDKTKIKNNPRSIPTNDIKNLNLEHLKSPNISSNFCNEILNKYNSSSDTDPYKRLASILPAALKKFLPLKRKNDKDWFCSAKGSISPLISHRNNISQLLKSSNTLANKILLKYARQRINLEVRKAKNSWIQKLALSVNQNCNKGPNRAAWTAINSLKKGNSSIRKCSNTNLKKRDKTLCKSPQENAQTFKEHFENIYQKQLPYDVTVLDDIPNSPIFTNAAAIPSPNETKEAIKKLNSSAAGLSQIRSDVWKCLANDPATLQIIHDFIVHIWTSEAPPQEWNTGLLKILPKKGDLHDTNNYRGIMLLETAYKIMANILRSRLTPIAESIDQESQCGFRPGRSTIDAIFSLKISLMKRKEHGLDTYILFLDLVKAFDKVPREMLWKVLHKFGVPPKLINLLGALHTNVQVQFESHGVSESFQSKVGVKQGDILGPILFNFYIAAILISWRSTSSTTPCSFQTNQDFLINGRNHLSTGDPLLFRDSAFADDTAVAFINRSETDSGTNEIISHFLKFGMTVHTGNTTKISKSEIVHFPANPSIPVIQNPVICPNNTSIPFSTKFPYLGSTLASDLTDSKEIENRIEKAGNTYNALRKPIFNNLHINMHSKSKIYKAIVVPTLIYGAENWCLKASHERKLQTYHHGCIRRICKLSRLHLQTRHITMKNLRDRTKIPSILTFITRHQLRYAGHIARMGWHRFQRKILSSWVNNNRRNGSPGMTYARALKRALQRANINIRGWHTLAQDRAAWKKKIHDVDC